jgi:hypothetical protein
MGVAPLEVLDRRLVKKGNQSIPQVLIKWSNIPVESATWEDYYVVKTRFPDAVAWGQASSAARGGVTTEEVTGDTNTIQDGVRD